MERDTGQTDVCSVEGSNPAPRGTVYGLLFSAPWLIAGGSRDSEDSRARPVLHRKVAVDR